MHVTLLEIIARYYIYETIPFRQLFYSMIKKLLHRRLITLYEGIVSGSSREEVIVGAAFLRPEARERNKWTIEAPQNPKGG